MAVNCFVVPLAIVGFAGVTAIDVNTVGPTVNVVLPVIAPEVALICEVPCPAPLARPPAVMVAAAVFDETHVDELVTSSNVPSE